MDIPRVIIVRTVLFLALQGVCILDHFGIQTVEGLVRNGIFHHDQTIMIEATDCNLEILGRQPFVLDFIPGWSDAGGKAGHGARWYGYICELPERPG